MRSFSPLSSLCISPLGRFEAWEQRRKSTTQGLLSSASFMEDVWPCETPWHSTGSDTACVESKRLKHFPKENLSPPDHKSQTALKRSCSTRWQKPLKRLGNFKTYSKETAFTQNQALEANYTASSTPARTEGLPEYQALWDQALGEGQGRAASCQCPQGTLPKPGWFPIITQFLLF